VKQQTTEKQGYGELQELVSLLNFFRIGLSLRISPIVKKKCNVKQKYLTITILLAKLFIYQ